MSPVTDGNSYWMAQNRMVDFDSVIPGFYGHASNLLISYGLIVVYGLVRLLSGGRVGEIAVFTGIVIAANYFYELVLTLWNTKDIVDAHYGAAASLATLALLAAIERWGLTTTAAQPTSAHPASSTGEADRA